VPHPSALKKGRGAYYRTMREAMATSCAIFQNLRPNEKNWQAFLRKAEEVETPYNPRKNPDLAAVICYAFPDTSYTQCIKYAAGLQLLIDEGVELRRMPKEIEERGGIDELYSQAKAKKKAAGEKEGNETENEEPGQGGRGKQKAHGSAVKKGRGMSESVKPGAKISTASPEDDGTKANEDEDEEDQPGNQEPEEGKNGEAAGDNSRDVSDHEAAAGWAASKLAREAVAKGLDWLLVQLSTKSWTDFPLFAALRMGSAVVK
jgi:hypothetical protein